MRGDRRGCRLKMPWKRLNLVGQRFGRLQVTSLAGLNKHGRTIWNCVCDCGNTAVVDVGHLRIGHTTSCGCKGSFPRPFAWRPTHHGWSGTPTYRSWLGLMARCLNPNNKRWHRYGGRGIKVCDRWMVFENFLADMGEKPEGKTLERRNNNGNYEPDNCYWATPKQQMNNTRRTVFIEYNGERLPRTEWARRLGFTVDMLRSRLDRGWSLERALTEPCHVK